MRTVRAPSLALRAVILAGCASNDPIPIDAGIFHDAAVVDAAQFVDSGAPGHGAPALFKPARDGH